MNKYLLKMFEEFKKAYGITDIFDNFNNYQDLFAEWVFAKRKAAGSYSQLFDYMETYDERQTLVMAEFGKGAYDTMAIEMAKNTIHQPIIISPYADTIKPENEIQAYKGELIKLNNDEVIVKYRSDKKLALYPNCHPLLNEEIGTFMTQLPLSTSELEPFFALLDSYNTLFIGTYGASSDKDKEEKLALLKSLYSELSNIGYRDVNYCNETQDNSYLSAIKISGKPKVKELTLTLRR